MEYLKLFGHLNQFKVRYLICGGLAVNIYGIPRMTADIDILLDFEEQNITNFESAIKLLLYKNSIPISLKTLVNKEERLKVMKDKNMIVYSYFSPNAAFVSLDVLLDAPIEFNKMWEKKSSRKSNDTVLHLVNIQDLIALKQYSNRLQDQNDILLLSQLIK